MGMALFLIVLVFMMLWLMGMTDSALAASERRDARKRRARSRAEIVRWAAESPLYPAAHATSGDPDGHPVPGEDDDEDILAVGSKGEVLAFSYYAAGGAATIHEVVNWIEYPHQFAGDCPPRGARRRFRKDHVLEWIAGHELLIDPDG